jgi:hypothetical protein
MVRKVSENFTLLFRIGNNNRHLNFVTQKPIAKKYFWGQQGNWAYPGRCHCCSSLTLGILCFVGDLHILYLTSGPRTDGTLIKWNAERENYYSIGQNVRFYTGDKMNSHFQGPPWAVPWLRRLVAGLPPRRPGFDLGSVHVGFVVDKVALGQVFPPEYFGFPLPVSFHRCSITRKRTKNNNHLHLHQGCTITGLRP